MGYYPHGKPGHYAYTTHFVEEFGGKTAYLAEANTKYPGLGGDANRSVITKALWNLKVLIEGARAAELAFIRDTGINIEDPSNSRNIFETINLILNSKQTFERGMNYMRRLAGMTEKDEVEGRSQTFREVTSFFASYLEKAIKEEMHGKGPAAIAKMDKNQVEQLINNIITNALNKTYTNVQDFIGPNGEIRGKFGKNPRYDKETEEARQAISDMLKIINKLGEKGAFKDFGYLFGMKTEDLMKNNNTGLKKLKKKKFNNAQVKSNYSGNALELITSLVAAEIGNINIRNPNLTITGMHTGQLNQMKADTLLFVGKANINPGDYLELIDSKSFNGSVRRQNVDALPKYLNKLENSVQHVIAISDKNYSIKSSFNGINAQEKMDLSNVGSMLNDFGVDQTTELINYLANCGDFMVQGRVEDEVRTNLQSYIGYFLFDNLQIEINGSSRVNVVNLMNVSGMYIPLSIYLQGVYDSIQDAASNPSSLVSVTVSLGGPTAQSVWTAETWEKFREEHETQSFISYRILKGIADFITKI